MANRLSREGSIKRGGLTFEHEHYNDSHQIWVTHQTSNRIFTGSLECAVDAGVLSSTIEDKTLTDKQIDTCLQVMDEAIEDDIY